MTVSESPAKICQICRKDVARIKRVKDPKGQYYCEPCYANQQQSVKQAGATAPARAATVPPVLKSPEGKSCPGCQAPLAADAVFCVACGYNLRLGKQATTAVKKSVDWMGWLSVIPFEVYLTAGAMALFAAICLATPLFTTAVHKVCGFSLIFITLVIVTMGSRKCRRILVDEYGWSETLFRIPILRNFVFLGGLLSVPRLWLITLRYGVAATVFTVAAIFMLGAFVHGDANDGGDSSEGPHTSQVSHSASFATPPAFSKRDSGVEVARLKCEGPDHAARQLWIYRPKGSQGDHSLPCIFIAPNGTQMIYGSALDGDDSEEYDEYAQQGFVVVAYSLDGGDELASDAAAVRAIKAFKAARGGIANAQQAIEYVLHNVPEVDPERLYTFGRDSGGAVALCVAAADRRISAVYAFGPGTDAAAGRVNAETDLAKLEKAIPDVREFVREVSPINHVREMHCPIFLYQPGLDLNLTRVFVEGYSKALTEAGVDVTYHVGPSDMQAIMKEGVPPGILWLKGLKSNAKPAATDTAPAQ